MLLILALFAVLIVYDLQKFIQQKAQARVFVLYTFFMTVSLIISLFLAAGKRPSSPAQWIETVLAMIGVVK